jgi:hypothetical protein
MHPDYINHPGHADHNPALTRQWQPIRRNPVMAIARRIISTDRQLWALWETSIKGRVNEFSRSDEYLPPLVSYVRLLRRRNRLESALDRFLP